MRVCIHRGAREIGGNCVEIEAQGKRIVLDIGLPLNADPIDVLLPPVPGFQQPDESLMGVVISHPHLDHYGLAHKLPAGTPFLIGAAALRILKAASAFVPGEVRFDRTIPLEHRGPIRLGPFTITPYLVDHSAYDSYAVLVEADGKRLFYSGDIRGHGRKAVLFERLVAHPPKNVDCLLLEGTTLGREDGPERYPTEAELESRFEETFRGTKGMALVWCSGQNIDRLVTVYKAARHAGRQFIADMYTAGVLRAIGNPRLPQPGWAGFRVFLPWSQKRKIIRRRLFRYAAGFGRSRIYPEQLAGQASRSVMLFRPSMQKDVEKAGCLDGAHLIYSMWPGYLKDEQHAPFLECLDRRGIGLTQCHTSGHAPVADLQRLAKSLAPKILVPIHCADSELFRRYFGNVLVIEDGQPWEV